MTTVNIDEIEKYMDNVDYPASKHDLVEGVRRAGARDEIVSLLEELPEQKFGDRTEVKQVLNQIIQKQRDTGPR